MNVKSHIILNVHSNTSQRTDVSYFTLYVQVLACSYYRVSINSFPDYKHLLQEYYLDMLELYVAPQLEEFQPWIIFQQDGAPPHWGSDVRQFFGCNISKQVDWERWSDTLATTITGYHPP